jgi:hypothetical protein
MLKIKKKSSDIYGFIHIGVMNGWKEILEDEMAAIHNSGLFKETKAIFVGISGKKVSVPFGTQLAVHNPKIEDGENETIKFLHAKSKELEDAKFWYIHTKGARWKMRSKEAINSKSWRKYMQFFIIDHWRDCVKTLEEYDACGVEWSKSRYGPYIFSGNFWWATSNYLRKIDKPLVDYTPYGNNRFKAEFFISLANPKVKTFHIINSYNGNLYGKFIKPSEYIRSRIKMI